MCVYQRASISMLLYKCTLILWWSFKVLLGVSFSVSKIGFVVMSWFIRKLAGCLFGFESLSHRQDEGMCLAIRCVLLVTRFPCASKTASYWWAKTQDLVNFSRIQHRKKSIQQGLAAERYVICKAALGRQSQFIVMAGTR